MGQVNNDRSSTFALRNNVALYGGFVSTETLRTQRDWAVHVTVLSGDVDTDVRLAATRALGKSKEPVAVAALGRALEDSDPAIQYRAVLSLRGATGENLGNDVRRWRQYVAGQQPTPADAPSLAERVLRRFRF